MAAVTLNEKEQDMIAPALRPLIRPAQLFALAVGIA
jgi:hypothetical protein